MRYRETRERSAEILRTALSLMARQEAAYHPQSYTLWYEHVARINPRLSEALEQHLAANMRLTDEDAWRLHAHYVIARDVEIVERMQQHLQSLLDDTSRIATSAGEEASQFTQTLQLHQGQLLQPLALDLVQSIVADLIADTERMRMTTTELAEQLERSAREVRTLTEQLEHAEKEALLDPLTGLLNRRGFERRMGAHQTDDQTHGLIGGVLLVADIDRFKIINDTHGHLLGDKVIRSVAQVLCNNIKGRDIAARLGGEEFAAYLPQTSIAGGVALAEQIRSAVATGRIRRKDGEQQVGQVTLSIGVAPAEPGDTLDQLIMRADQAMYAAKAGGRNRVSIASNDLAPESSRHATPT
jgi:diguanylate cyclase